MNKNQPVFFYIPNLICYGRLILTCLAAFFALDKPILAATFYVVSEFSDAFDGYFARRLNQASHFGAVLDYIVDRAWLCVVIIMMSVMYPKFWLGFAFILVLDIISHISHVYSSLFLNRSHHKAVDHSHGYWLNLYYTNRKVLFTTCFLHNFIFFFIYLNYFFPHQTWLYVGGLICLPGFIFKTFIHILQLKASFQGLMELDAK